jgi:hypothetical protein
LVVRFLLIVIKVGFDLEIILAYVVHGRKTIMKH